MLDLVKGAKLIVETCVRVKPGEKVLVVTDSQAFPMRMGTIVMDTACEAGAEATLAVMKPREIAGQEPPQAIAAAMKSVNAVIYISNTFAIGHTNASKEAFAAGTRVYFMTQVPEDYFKREITVADLNQIKERTERVSQKLAASSEAWITAPGGTNLKMQTKGRKSLGIHPLADVRGSLPDYAEAAISPVEGTAEGTIVYDVSILGWNYLLRSPIRCTVKGGRMVEVSGGADGDRLKGISQTDENSSNIAELGIGTSHTIPRVYKGTRRDGGMAGNVHIAIGRNNDIGGVLWSRIHVDGLVDRPTVRLDGELLLKDGEVV